jgi:sulfane dehydrogenase subunit SoxC
MRGELEAAAGNGLINRRALLGRGMMIAGAAGAGIGGATAAGAEPLTEEPWSLEFGDRTVPYQVPSKFEAKVVRTLSTPRNDLRNSHSRTPHHLLEGVTTPNGLHFTINHGGIPAIDPDKHRLVIHGLVKRPLEFSVEALSRYPLVTRTAFVECGGNSAPMFSPEPLQETVQALHGLASCAEWTGVKLSTLLDETGIDPKAEYRRLIEAKLNVMGVDPAASAPALARETPK